jgi:hypothetical protein
MRSLRTIVSVSLFLSCTSIAAAIYSSSAKRKHSASADGLTSLILGGLLVAVICCWPWFLAYSRAQAPEYKEATVLFSVASALAAVAMYIPISGAPVEGVGYHVALYVLGVWVIGPLVLRMKSAA